MCHIALLGIYGPCTQGRPISVASDDITFPGGPYKSKIRAHCRMRNDHGCNSISGLYYSIRENGGAVRVPPKTTPHHQPLPFNRQVLETPYIMYLTPSPSLLMIMYIHRMIPLGAPHLVFSMLVSFLEERSADVK